MPNAVAEVIARRHALAHHPNDGIRSFEPTSGCAPRLDLVLEMIALTFVHGVPAGVLSHTITSAERMRYVHGRR
jgi:hypothetical protein